MTWVGRGEPSLTEPVPVARTRRQGSVSSAELLGLERARTRGPWRGLVFLALLMAAILVGGGVFAGPRLRDMAFDVARSNPQAMRLPMIPDIVRDRLGDGAFAAAGERATTIKFTVQGGQGVAQVARSLADQGIIQDPLAFTYLAVTQGVDGKLHTGTFNLTPIMTPQQILDRLLLPPDPETTRIFVPIRSGLRIEQITALLSTKKELVFSAQEFYDLAMRPPAWVREEFPWLEALPRGRSLEGFLGADSNLTIDSDLTADGFLRVLLADWEKDVGPDVIREVERKGKDFYETLTLASIVEHETSLASERRKVAGVYTNRLKGGGETAGLLQADPTVSYAVDTDQLAKQDVSKWGKYAFWSPVRNQAKKKVSAGMQSYQTYQNQGLPDGPIASPTLSSILAAADPDTKDGYYYFFACDPKKAHQFAKTLREHSRNVNRCK
ncbi:MAG: endolytic transglycosylase MltG [Chloroflexi bacterium]|nr:endolytic transglycosylase MltG [Chloroflexota bacterium]